MNTLSLDLNKIRNVFSKISNDSSSILNQDNDFENESHLKQELIHQNLNQSIQMLNSEEKERILSELNGFGPLQHLISNDDVTEILINQFDQIFFEIKGRLQRSEDHFFDSASYHHFIEKICSLCKTYLSAEKPFIECQYGLLRLTVLSPDICRGEFIVSIRKQPQDCWTFDKLKNNGWATESEFNILQTIIRTNKNFLIIGGTGSGKTSFLQSVIHAVGEKERLVIIEDTQELHPLFPQNVSLLSRIDPTKKIMDLNLNDLLKKALRLRPDRLCVGEIRGEEATALLMALATGHDGSFGSMHARTAPEALLRLEMLIQMGAPQWSLQSIRKLIGLTVNSIIVVEKVNGQRKLAGIFQISSVEENGITLQNLLEN